METLLHFFKMLFIGAFCASVGIGLAVVVIYVTSILKGEI